ncbi:MAG TPA: GNAT family N-acetyltransferase [Allosphingosinicella sp.]|nr:GNAT family N-acetyltransferase [Allosphingosinicella sp.]
MFARTERLLLRPGWREDAPALLEAIADEAIVRNLAKAPWPYTMADAEAFLGAERGPTEFASLIFRRTPGSPELVGCAGLGRTPEGEVELGYWIAKPYWGLGYASEAAEAVIEIARRGLRLEKLVASHFTDNPASGRVLEKLGFRPTGQFAKRYSVGRGEAAACKLFELDLQEEAIAAPEEDMDFVKAFCVAA